MLNELITRTQDVGKKTNGFPVDLLAEEEAYVPITFETWQSAFMLEQMPAEVLATQAAVAWRWMRQDWRKQNLWFETSWEFAK